MFKGIAFSKGDVMIGYYSSMKESNTNFYNFIVDIFVQPGQKNIQSASHSAKSF